MSDGLKVWDSRKKTRCSSLTSFISRWREQAKKEAGAASREVTIKEAREGEAEAHSVESDANRASARTAAWAMLVTMFLIGYLGIGYTQTERAWEYRRWWEKHCKTHYDDCKCLEDAVLRDELCNDWRNMLLRARESTSKEKYLVRVIFWPFFTPND